MENTGASVKRSMMKGSMGGRALVDEGEQFQPGEAPVQAESEAEMPLLVSLRKNCLLLPH